MAKKKPLTLEPYRKKTLTTFTVEVYCIDGMRQAAPVKRMKGMFVQQEMVQGYTVMSFWDKESWAKHSFDSEPPLYLVFASTVMQMDGIWVYGMEQFFKGDKLNCYYQALCLLPEPNEYTEETDVKKGANRSGGSS